MNITHRKIINDNLDTLIDVTEHLDSILNVLLEKRVINKYMAKSILGISDRKGKIREFYLLMTGRGSTAYQNLRECLRHTRNIKAAEVLETYRKTEAAYVSSDRNQEFVNSTYSPVFETKFVSEMDIMVHPDKKFMDEESENLPNGVFRMRSRPKGYALIINIENAVGMSRRFGSDLDFRNVCNLFKGLGYEIDARVDLSKEEFEKTVKNFSQKPALSKVDSLVVFIMSHGTQKGNSASIELSTADGFTVNTKWIIEQFTLRSPCLITGPSVRKPKIFFFQACRGDGIDIGREYDNKVSIDAVSFSGASVSKTTFRQYEDVMIVNSTVNGYYSKRDPKEGGWFVGLFCNIVAKNAWCYDLETMIGQVDQQMRMKKDSTYGYQTTEIVKQGLHKKIFFNPSLYEDEINDSNDHDKL